MSSDRLGAPWRRRIVALCLGFCALAFDHAPAHAQEARDGAQADAAAREAEYKELIEQALAEFKHKNWPEARVLFRRAHEISPNARTLRGMGIVSYEMRDYVQAVRELGAALADSRQPLTEAQRKECEGLLARARTFVGVFDVRAEPAEAEITVDGSRVVRQDDGTVILAFGEHAFRATLPGYQDATARVAVEGGERGEVTLRLSAEGLAAAPVASTVESERLPEPEQTSEPAPAEPNERRFAGGGLRYTWVALGASAAFGAAAGAFWYLGDRELDDLDAACARAAEAGAPCVKGDTDTDAVKRYERLTNAAIGLSAGSLVTAVVLAIFEWPRERDVQVSVSPTSLSIRGSF